MVTSVCAVASVHGVVDMSAVLLLAHHMQLIPLDSSWSLCTSDFIWPLASESVSGSAYIHTVSGMAILDSH